VSKQQERGREKMKGTLASYVGDELNGKRHGKGIYYYSNGDTYDGDWLDGERHGRGTYTWSCVTVYVGEWHQGLMHGRGIYTWSHGDVYDGKWENANMHGHGKHVYSDGDVFVGTYRDDNEQYGTITYKSGPVASYTGYWRDSEYNGEGVVLYRNGDRYEGTCIDGKKSGRGTQTFKKDARGLVSFDGEWQQDQFNSGVILYTNTDSYNVQIQNGVFHGQGVHTHNDDTSSNTYSGLCVNGKRSGAGQVTLYNNDILTDMFDNDKAVGGGDARYINVTTGTVSTGDAALQLARDHGAEHYIQRARKQPRRFVDEMNAEADAANSRKGKQKRRKIAATAATVAAAVAAAAEPDVSDHDNDDYVDIDNTNSFTNDNDNSTVSCTDSSGAQGCIYAYTVPTDGGNSSGKTLYSVGVYNTCDRTALIDHLEATIDTTKGYKLNLMIPCTQGTQQQLLKRICNEFIANNTRPENDGKFLTTLTEIMSTHLICIGGQVNV
jgi:hypothetical protein